MYKSFLIIKKEFVYLVFSLKFKVFMLIGYSFYREIYKELHALVLTKEIHFLHELKKLLKDSLAKIYSVYNLHEHFQILHFLYIEKALYSRLGAQKRKQLFGTLLQHLDTSLVLTTHIGQNQTTLSMSLIWRDVTLFTYKSHNQSKN